MICFKIVFTDILYIQNVTYDYINTKKYSHTTIKNKNLILFIVHNSLEIL